MLSKFFKNKYKFTIALSALFLAVTIAASSFAWVSGSAAALPVFAGFGAEEKESKPESNSMLELESEWEPESETLPAPDFLEEEMSGFVSLNAPTEMRGTILVPGVDFLKTGDTSEETVRKEIDAALQSAQDLTINTIIVETARDDLVIYQTRDAAELSSGFDILAYIVESARHQGFYTFATFDVSRYNQKQPLTAMAIGAGGVNRLAGNLGEFAEKYGLDGILIDGYQQEDNGSTYNTYLELGGGIGFGNFMRQSPAATVKTAANAIRDASPSTLAGLLADAVWENQSVNGEGSATEAAFTSLSSGNADTKSFVEKGYVDFVAVKAYSAIESQTEPFLEVVRWWAGVARQNDIPLYIVHAASKVGSGEAGWSSQDQLLQQMMEASEVSGFRGSIFNSLSPLTAVNTNLGASVTKVYDEETPPEQVLTQLEMTRPEQTTFTTSERSVTFTGASDPAEPVTINDKRVETDSTGYFTVQIALKAGLNNFTVKHKDKTISYAITRKVELLTEAGPMGEVAVEGGMSVTVSAVAYEDANVYAVVGGATIPMSVDTSVEDEQTRDGSFRIFTGQYTAPAATGETQNVGSITVHAEYDGESDSIQCGSIKVNKKTKVEDGVAVRVVADQAITYPPGTANNIPHANYYPLPRGAMDYVVGNEITYTKDKKTYTYSVLASGMRVESKDITAISDDFPANNAISGLTVSAESGYTYVTLKTAQKVSYSVAYASTGMSFKFHNTASVPGNLTLSQNPMFTSASWSGTTLTLGFVKQGSFMGYKGYYDENGNLVLRFNNPPSSISGARIAIDPGHGGGDQGAPGFLADYPEKVLTLQISQYLAAELEARGATVNLMNNAGIEGPQRKEAAENWGADLLVSVHCNSAPNASATGTEVYYFQPFNYRLATNASSAVSSGLNTNNRGAKASYYHVTLSSQMQSVLVETGFLSNKGEYEKLLKKSYQKAIAVGIADALSATIKGTSTGVSASGSESTGAAANPGNGESSSSDEPAEEVYLEDLTVSVGAAAAIKTSFYPDGSSAALQWKSSDTKIATVENGKVTGVKEGSATITATAEDGSFSGKCTVTVSASGGTQGSSSSSEGSSSEDSGIALSSAEDAYFDYNEVTINMGGTTRLEILSETGQVIRGGDFTWKSQNTNIATVDSIGVVSPKREGETTITATASGYKLECLVSVTNKQVKVTSIAFEQSSYSVLRNQTLQLKLNFQPTGATNKNVTYSSSDSYKASVDSSGLLTAKKPGTVTITAKSKDGGYTATCTVTITSKAVEPEYIEMDEQLELYAGETDQIYYTVYPEDATDKSVTWKSANTGVVTVDAQGNIKAVKAGKTTITCTSNADPDIYETCTVTVLE